MAIVQVKPVTQGLRTDGKFITPAGYIQIQITITICIKERAPDIFAKLILLQGRLFHLSEASIPLLHKQCSRLPFGSTNIEICKAIAIHIPGTHLRTLRRTHLNKQSATLEVVKTVFLVSPAGSSYLFQNRF
jgi:hypothetical protein